MSKKLYIFAVDGVLVDSKHILSQAVEETMEKAGMDTGLANLVSEHAFDISDALSLPEDEESRELLLQVLQIYQNNVQPMRGAVNVLQTTKHKCVVSSDAKITARVSLFTAGLIGFFDGQQIFTLDIFQPARVSLSELLKFAARSMEFETDHCVFVTDEVGGILAAKDAGMQAIGFIGGSHILSTNLENDMKAAGASHVIANMSNLSGLMEAA